MPGSTAQTNKFHTFYLQQRPDNGDTWADIKVNHPLDYESIKEYNLTIRVEVSYLNLNNILSHQIKHWIALWFTSIYHFFNNIWNNNNNEHFYQPKKCNLGF